jgi:hypothetical protein
MPLHDVPTQWGVGFLMGDCEPDISGATCHDRRIKHPKSGKRNKVMTRDTASEQVGLLGWQHTNLKLVPYYSAG